jgi:thiol-disulfide isomerase/thioredoxin
MLINQLLKFEKMILVSALTTRRFILGILACLWAFSARTQSDIQIQINGYQQPWILVGYYHGGKAFRLDSLRTDRGPGHFSFKSRELHPGVFFCSDEKKVLFEFIVQSSKDSFQLETQAGRLDSVVAKNSPENTVFFAFEKQKKSIEARYAAKKTMRDMVAQATENDPEVLKPIDLEMDRILQENDSLATAFSSQNPNHLYAKMLTSVRPPDPPAQLLRPQKNGKAKPELFYWKRKHYWDNTDFQDEALLNNKFWQIYFDNFFSSFVAPQPDSLIAGIDEVMAKTPRNGAFYRFMVMRFTQFFEQNEATGADRIFVHMVDKYQQKNETPWLDMATLERLAYKADMHRPNLTGSMAINFVLPDENNTPVDLYNIEAPLTMLVFYSPLCSHCMELMPKIYQVYLDYQPRKLAAIAINIDEQQAYWKKFVGQQNWTWYDVCDPAQKENLEKQFAAYNLPVVYLLDKNKRILAKRVKPENLGKVIASLLK